MAEMNLNPPDSRPCAAEPRPVDPRPAWVRRLHRAGGMSDARYLELLATPAREDWVKAMRLAGVPPDPVESQLAELRERTAAGERADGRPAKVAALHRSLGIDDLRYFELRRRYGFADQVEVSE